MLKDKKRKEKKVYVNLPNGQVAVMKYSLPITEKEARKYLYKQLKEKKKRKVPFVYENLFGYYGAGGSTQFKYPKNYNINI